MEVIGFKVPREAYREASEALLAELDKLVSNPDQTVLQVVLTWDEFATLAPALDKASRGEDKWRSAPTYSRYSVSNLELTPPQEDLTSGGTYKGVDIYVRKRPVSDAVSV